MSTQLEKEVVIIPAKYDVLKEHQTERQINVCAYCRVSTESDEQTNSIESQQSHFIEVIHRTPKWKFYDCFVDHGISGASAKKRPAFMEMIKACKKGKIDLIITKSISRFSRNLIETLEYLNLLKSIGVGIIFDQEGIDTRSEYSDMIFTVLASMAQSEMLSTSKNVITGIHNMWKQGKFTFPYNRIYGYERGKDDQPKIVEKEAEMIRYVFERYLMGESARVIADSLNKNYVSKFGKKFSDKTVYGIIKNEIFCGDIILQKTFVSDPITKKVKTNNGERPKFYIKNNHVGIITREMFEKVQLERAKRNNKQYVSPLSKSTQILKYSSTHAFSSLLICGCCGAEYRRKTWQKRSGENVRVWRCITRVKEEKYCHNSPSFQEEFIENAILKSIETTQAERKNLIQTLTHEIKHTTIDIMKYTGTKTNVEIALSRIDVLQKELTKVIEQMSSDNFKPEDNEKITQLSAEIIEERKSLNIGNRNDIIDEVKLDTHIDEIASELEKEYNITKCYSNELTKQLIHTIEVINKDTIKIFYYCGLVDTQKVETIRDNNKMNVS